MTETLIAQPTPVVSVHAADPVTRLGIANQLRRCAGVTLAEARPGRVDVAVVALAAVDTAALERLQLLRSGGARLVAVVPAIDAAALLPAIAAGVRAVLRRDELTPARLLGVVRTVTAGGIELPAAVVRRLVDLACAAQPAPSLHLAALTPRERDVLRLVAQGRSTREVAGRLAYSERTIKNVLQDVTARLQLRNRTHAVAYAVRHGLI